MTIRSPKSLLTLRVITLVAIGVLLPTDFTVGQDKQLSQAMSFRPKHARDVVYEKPGVAVLKACKIGRTKNPPGFVVYHETGRILRKFVDTNDDEKLDQWSYFQDGLEVYRDIDSNFDENLDQYRWFGPGGTRWGIDNNQDGQIDSWKVISPEEVALECFQAIKNRDAKRFNRLLVSQVEIKDMGLSSRVNAAVIERWKNAQAKFLSMAQSQSIVGPKSKWVYAGNGQPAAVSSGDGGKKSIVVYDHASGFFDNGPSTHQIALGSMVKVGNAWRLVELPEIVDPKKPLGNGGGFFPREEFGDSTSSGPDPNDQELAKLLDDLTTIETKLKSAKGVDVERNEKAKADVLVKLVRFYSEAGDQKNANNWQENLADSVSSAYQLDRFDGGIDYLNRYMFNNKNAPGLDYVKWRSIFSEYAWVTSNGNRKQLDAAQKKLFSELEAFQKNFPNSERFTPDALVQLAVQYEVSGGGDTDNAIKWYAECSKRFPKTKYGKRSAGALKRLSSDGKPITFVGSTAGGQRFDISRAKGQIVVLHFWETWCCTEDDVKSLAKLQSKYKDDLRIIGCNIEGPTGDETKADATKKYKEFLSRYNKTINWLQLHAPGSVDSSPLAHQLGIATEPTVILIDRTGRLVDTNLSIEGLEQEIQRERRRRAKR